MFRVVSKDLGGTCNEQKIAKSRKTVVGKKKRKIIITKKTSTYLPKSHGAKTLCDCPTLARSLSHLIHRKISVHTVYKYIHVVKTWKRGLVVIRIRHRSARVRKIKCNRNKPGQGDPNFFLKTYIRPIYYYNVLLYRQTRRL